MNGMMMGGGMMGGGGGLRPAGPTLQRRRFGPGAGAIHTNMLRAALGIPMPVRPGMPPGMMGSGAPGRLRKIRRS